MTLHLSEDLELPEDAVTQTFGFLGKRGVGKTYTASVLGEEMLGIRAQLVVLDPLDAWWGLRIAADGKSDGFQILVLGGRHGDLPLDPTSGVIVADLVVEHGLSIVLSLRHMSKNNQRRFVADFCERLYHRKGEDEHRTPLHIAIDEADLFAPQRVFAGMERMVGAFDDLVRRGRSSGIGVSLITQRAAAINKDVLTQIEVLVVHKTISPQDRKALEAWVEAHDVHGQRQEFMSSLASLKIGVAWFWSPGWLDIFQKVTIRRRTTYDSSATPKVDDQRPAPRQLPPLDLDHIRNLMVATVEKVKAEDPKVLQAQLRAAEKRIAELSKARPALEVQHVEVPVIKDSDLQFLEAIAKSLESQGTAFLAIASDVRDDIRQFRERVLGQLSAPTGQLKPGLPARVEEWSRPAKEVIASERRRTESESEPLASSLGSKDKNLGDSAPNLGSNASDVELDAGALRILKTLAERAPMKFTRSQVAMLCDYKASGGRFQSLMSALRKAGNLIEHGGLVEVTDAGMERARAEGVALKTNGPYDLQEMWRAALAPAERKLFDVLAEVRAKGLTRQELAERTGYEARGGRFQSLLSVLRQNDLVEVRGGHVRLSATFLYDHEDPRGSKV